MKSRTSVTLDRDLLLRLDRVVGPTGNRSAVLEQALREYLTERERRDRDARDRKILERHRAALERETRDALGYQKAD